MNWKHGKRAVALGMGMVLAVAAFSGCQKKREIRSGEKDLGGADLVSGRGQTKRRYHGAGSSKRVSGRNHWCEAEYYQSGLGRLQSENAGGDSHRGRMGFVLYLLLDQ